MRVETKIVGIVGRDAECKITVSPGEAVELRHCPGSLTCKAERTEETGSGTTHRFLFECSSTGRFAVEFDVGGSIVRVPAVVFREREFFLIMALSSNYHYGWDPLSYLMGGGPEDLELEGHAYPKLRQLEKMYHMRGIPITWLIDKHVAEVACDDIDRWHLEYGDDYAVMPTSLFNQNELNYNTRKTQEETTLMVRTEREEVERFFDFGTDVLAVDQWVGSIGTHFTHAAYELGFQGIWGIGFDHRTCDTSMFHRGCPWDVYKPSRSNYRIPANHDSNLWVFQWTTRDVINTMHVPNGGPGGSVIFSTDADDIRFTGIMKSQSDYWNKLLADYHTNIDHNDFFIFLVHQEDHDCGFPENAEYIRGFLDNISEDVTFATIQEVSQWLNLKYGRAEHPSQKLFLSDVLDCKDDVVFYCGIEKPEDWPNTGEHYPPHIAYYGPDFYCVTQQGNVAPLRWYDYSAQYKVEETDAYPEGQIPQIKLRSSEFTEQGGQVICSLTIESSADVQGIPIMLWDVPEDVVTKISEYKKYTVVGDALLVRVDLSKGLNDLKLVV